MVPGTYVVRLEVGGMVSENTLDVQEDPRIQVDTETRRAWTGELHALGALAREAAKGAREMAELAERVEAGTDVPEALATWAKDLVREWNELASRTRSLVREAEGWVGPLTQDQASRKAYFEEMVATLERETRSLAQRFDGRGGEEAPR